jgi:signal transduction histidine kinase
MHAADGESALNPRSDAAGRGGRRGVRSAEFDLRCLRRLWSFAGQFQKGGDVTKVTRAALRAGMDLLAARQGCVALLEPGPRQLTFAFSLPPDAVWDRELLTAFIRGSEQRVPGSLALGRLRRRGRMWGVLAVRATDGEFNWDHRMALSDVAAAANDVLERIDQERVREVRGRLFARSWLRPKDLFYQVLHGLHALTEYDHSGSLLIYRPGATALEVVAETITWKKGKSDKIGAKLPVPSPVLELLRPDMVYGFDRGDSAWQEWTGSRAASLAEFLDANDAATQPQDAPCYHSMLCAPLATRDGLLGLLKVAGAHAGSFGPYEAELVGQFLPHALIALQNAQRTETLELNLLQAERKHAMADLARGVAHDVNNALGAVLPLVQQMRAELEAGQVEPASLADDLRQIESSMQISRRIFGGMLSFARGTVQDSGGANIKQAIDNTRAILREGLERRGIQLVVDVQPDLPSIHGSQGELEQLFLNLLTNSRDAMPHGGRLTVSARRADTAIQLAVEDTGTGIPAEHLAQVVEPFFSTKPHGNGLGLSICRSIVWQLHGKLDIISTVGVGTKVTVTVPVERN